MLDLEYQWAHRRLGMVAAKRRPTKKDTTGWAEPDLILIEVKSEYSACSGIAGLGDHARDYQNIITSSDGGHVKDIKLEYENVIAQKTRLGRPAYEVAACIDGRGFRQRREDMRQMLRRLRGKVFTAATLDQLLTHTRIREFVSRSG